MSEIGDLKRGLEAAREAIESLDTDLAAGRLTAEQHASRRAEREREAGRLFVDLRRAQRAAHESEAPPAPRASAPAAAATSGVAWLRNPLALGAIGVLIVVVGVLAGILAARWNAPPPAGGGAPAVTAPPSAGMAPMELAALRQAAARPDAPPEALLQLAHVELDAGRLGEAQRIYERVLARDPRNAEAITHTGAVAYQEGRLDVALAKVEEALRIDPRYIHALWDRVQYLQAKRDPPGTVRAAEAFLKVVPDGPDADSVKKILAEAQRQVGAR